MIYSEHTERRQKPANWALGAKKHAVRSRQQRSEAGNRQRLKYRRSKRNISGITGTSGHLRQQSAQAEQIAGRDGGCSHGARQ